VHHYDIGSSANSIGIISQFTPTTMIDIRPIDLKLDGLHFIEGSILAIPFEDNSIQSLSSLCVIEHIGLGRYGDQVDAFGSEKAAQEIQRVLAKGGNFYCSLPVDSECKIYFNAHRAFTRAYVLELFSGLSLVEEKYHYGRAVYDFYDAKKGFGTGLFYFTKG
jgi:ubiquinone/menaquinone biosynthesis C-methylase UbiE